MTDKIDPIYGRLDANSEGLDDRSEELSERSEADAQIRFYRAMADSGIDDSRLLTKLARAVAEVIFDLCAIYLIDDEDDQGLRCTASYHPHAPTLQALRRTFLQHEQGLGEGLIRRVITRRESYFRPRWRPSLLKAYAPEQAPEFEISIHSLMVVPLITTDGTCLGALLVGRHTTSLSYDETDLALTQWIASHAAMKLETAHLYRDLRKTNERLDTAVQDRNTFISIASHELRTPLSTLKLHVQMLQRRATTTPQEFTAEEALPKLAAIDRQVDRLDNLIDQLLNVSRIIDGGSSPRPAPCEFTSVIREVVRRFDYELDLCGSTLTLDCDGDLPGLWDRERLDHIATNLLSNAIKYGEGNPIVITIARHQKEVILQVADQGSGIASQAQAQIFERFHRGVDRRHSKGLGLGLWIVREYVESMNGRIRLQSTVGKGSTFVIQLPYTPLTS